MDSGNWVQARHVLEEARVGVEEVRLGGKHGHMGGDYRGEVEDAVGVASGETTCFLGGVQ